MTANPPAHRPGLHPVLDGIELVVFDKDGTLIDFHAMWSGWMVDLAARLSATAGHRLGDALYRAFGFDAATGRALPGGPLAVTPMADLRLLAIDALGERVPPREAEAAVDATWRAPDPVTLARPIADLRALFGVLRAAGLRIAVATSDDRQPTERTLAALGVAGLVDAIIAADDGLPVKPAPDAILVVAGRLGIAPHAVAVVGDAAADLEMARAAGARAIGVTSGVSSAAELAPRANVILPSIGSLAG